MPEHHGIWHRHGPQATIEADPSGLVIPWHPAHSYSYWFLHVLRDRMNGDTPIQVYDLEGDPFNMPDNQSNFFCQAVGSEDEVGIVLGHGTPPSGLGSNALGAAYRDPSKGGQVFYSDQYILNPEASGPDWVFVIQRQFSQFTGAPLTVTEQGLYGYPVAAPLHRYAMVLDALGAPWELPSSIPTLVQYAFNSQG